MNASELHHLILAAVPEGIWVVDTEGRTIFCNERMAGILRASLDSMPGRSCFDCVFPADLAEAQNQFARNAAGDCRPFDFRLRRTDDSEVWVSISCTPMIDDTGAAFGLLGLFADITERRRVEAELRESEERFRTMADTAPVMIWVSGPDKRCTFFNKTWLEFTGRSLEQELGNGWAEGVHPDDLDRCYESYCSSFDAHSHFNIEYRLRRADGEYRWMLCRGVPRFEPGGVFAGYIGSDIDITDLRRAQEESFKRQKLESLGVLTGGIAHDFNNLLGSIVSAAELAQANLAASSSPGEEIKLIKSVALQAAEIVRELMIYSGQDTASSEPVDVSLLVKEMLELLKISISKHAVLNTNLPKDMPAVAGNATQIRQIVMNLIINASEAIGNKKGVIGISTSRVIGGESLTENNAGRSSEGDYLRLEVSDTGCGMTPEVQARIFDPFFTTKFAGRGLGLAVVQGIVRAHDGALKVMSTPGRGTTFEVLLPCANHLGEQDSGANLAASAEEIAFAAGTVLLVEDEDTLRSSVSKMLRKTGFSVIEAGDGSTAINLLRSRKDEIDVILLDMTIPGSSSREVIAEAGRIRPEIKIILTTAYSREMATPALNAPQLTGFIRKPFLLSDLVQLLRDAISGWDSDSSASS